MFQMLKAFGTGGLALDPFEESLSPQQWGTISNMDTQAGDLVSPAQDVPLIRQCPIQPRWIFAYTVGRTDYLFVSDGYKVYSTTGGVWTDFGVSWQGGLVTWTVLLGSLVINSATDGPYYWFRGSADATGDTWAGGWPVLWNSETSVEWALPDDPDDFWNAETALIWRSESIRPWYNALFPAVLPLQGWWEGATCLQMLAYKNFLVALAVNDPGRSAELEPYLICWSDASPAGGVPTQWTATVANFAGDVLAQDSPGAISGGAILRDDVIVYKTDGSVYRLSYIEGSALVMALERIQYDGPGVPYPYAIAPGPGVHHLVTRSGLTVFDGQSMQNIDFMRLMDGIRNRFRLGNGEITQSATFPGRNQVWIAYRLDEAKPFDRILKFDLDHNAFTVHDYSGKDLVALCAARINGYLSEGGDLWATGASVNWAPSLGVNDVWDTGISTPIADTMILALGRSLARVDPEGTPSYSDGTPKRATSVKYGIRLGENPRRTIVSGIYPLVTGSGVLKFTLGRTWGPWQQGGPTPVTWGAQRTFTPGVSRFLPMRMIGDTFALKIESLDGEPWTLAGVGFEFEPLGDEA